MRLEPGTVWHVNDPRRDVVDSRGIVIAKRAEIRPLAAAPDPNRSSNEKTRTLLLACFCRSQAVGSNSAIQAARPDVTTSAARAKAALPNKDVPRLEASPAVLVVL